MIEFSSVQEREEAGILPDAPKPAKRSVLPFIFGVLFLGLLAMALATLALSFVSFATAEHFFDSHVAAHVHRAYVTQSQHNALFAHLRFVSGVFAFCAFSLGLFRRQLFRYLAEIPSEKMRVWSAVKGFFPPGLETNLELAAVSIVSAVGVFLRLEHIGRPVHYDEAFTYTVYASSPLYVAISDYSAPNNHLLNTLLVHFSTRLFGDTTFALRLPVLIAGSLVIVLSWLTGRMLYGRTAGILTAGFVAALPTFIEFSVNARGYSLQWFFVLAMMCLAVALYEDPNLKTGWLLFVLAGVGGTYTVPTMMIPIVGIVLWMLLSTVAARGILTAYDLLKKTMFAGLATAAISAFLYVPPFFVSGPGGVLQNRFVSSRKTSFFYDFGLLAQSTWMRWTEGVPKAAVWILVGGVVIGLAFNRKVSACRFPMTVVLWIWSFFFAWFRDVVGFPRIWSFLLLAVVMTASAGLALLLDLLARPSHARQVACAGVAAVLIAGFIGAALLRDRLLFQTNETGALIDEAQISDFVIHELRPGDALVEAFPAGPIVDYEILRREPKLMKSLSKPQRANRVIAVVPKASAVPESLRLDQFFAGLKSEDASDPNLVSDSMNLSEYDPPRVLANFLTTTVYSFQKKNSPVQQP